MRYRRVTYRYAVLRRGQEPWQVGDPWRTQRLSLAVLPPRWRPPTDLYETPTAFHLIVELAGVEEDDLEVLLYDDALVVEGRRRLPPCEAGGVFHTAEIRQGPFHLEMLLPKPFDPEAVDARYERGLVHITLTKSTES